MKDLVSPVRFVLDGHTVEVAEPSPTETLLQCLRERLGRRGVKEGCAEGDCGACTVVIGELRDSSIRYRAINSCIRLLPTVDGHEVVTTESLASPQGTLHPVQQAMVDCHASQCGFCTPGFVMSLFALWLARPDADRDDVVAALAGNLCRCTGYRPIIDAGLAMNRLEEPEHWGRAQAQSESRRTRLAALKRDSALRLAAQRGFVAPRTLDELAQTLQETPDALVLAGGTDVGLWVTKQLRELPRIVYIGEVSQLAQVSKDESGWVIGASVSLADAFEALCQSWPELSELALRFASPPVCNSGTLCGNIANGSPIGDSMPALLALNADLELRRGNRTRTVALADFYLGYRRNVLEPGEFVVAVRVPHAKPGHSLACWKVSKRFDQDISAVCMAAFLEERDGTIIDARLGFGGMAAIPARARQTEAALRGRALTEETLEAAIEALSRDFTPMTDMRASAAYRLRVAGNLIKRLAIGRIGRTVLRIEQVGST